MPRATTAGWPHMHARHIRGRRLSGSILHCEAEDALPRLIQRFPPGSGSAETGRLYALPDHRPEERVDGHGALHAVVGRANVFAKYSGTRVDGDAYAAHDGQLRQPPGPRRPDYATDTPRGSGDLRTASIIILQGLDVTIKAYGDIAVPRYRKVGSQAP